MKKIGILTFQNTLNFGAALQNYALYRALESMMFDVNVINYKSEAIERNESIVPVFGLKALFKYFAFKGKSRRFAGFKERMRFTDPCRADGLSDVCNRFDYVVVGSDQVWNTELTRSDSVYFLDLIDEPSRRKTYAVSMGYRELPPCDFDQRPLISGFSSILVREKSAAETIARECPDAPTPHVVLDPTLLVEKKIWEDIEQTPAYASETPYVLVYAVSEFAAAFEAAHTLADSNGTRIVNVRSFGLRRVPGVKSVLNVSPEEYLGLFAHAQATVVSSYHGLCFSIINHRDFYFSGKTSGKNTNSRATDLMDALGITGRTVQDLANGTVKPVDWDDVEARLGVLRAESLRLLEESLADVKGR